MSSRSVVPVEWRRALVLYVLPLAYFASLARSGVVMVDGDTYLHLTVGRWIIEHRQFVHSDFLSYTFAGAHWNDPEWLSEVVMATAYSLAGWSGVALLFAFAFGLTAFVLARQLLKYLTPLPAFVVLELSNYCIASGQSSRPYALALPILAIWAVNLVAARSEGRRPTMWLLPLMTLWANIHGSFLLGIGLAAVFALEAFVSAPSERWSTARSWFLFVAGAIGAAVINPNGIFGLIGAVQFTLRPILPGMLDWASTSFSRIEPFEIALLLLVGVCIVRPVRTPVLRLLLLLVLIHMALLHRRHINIFAVLVPILLAEPLARAFAPDAERGTAGEAPLGVLGAAAAMAASLVIAVVRLAVPDPQVNMYSPADALAHVPKAIKASPVFNEDVLGGYLIANGIKTFIDSRQEMVSDTFFDNYLRMCDPDRASIVRTFARYRIGWTIMSPYNAANSVLDTLPGWRLLYADKYAAVHVRADLLPEVPPEKMR